MENKNKIVTRLDIENRIYTIRGVQVMIDKDLAEMFGVETKRLNEQVRRNIERFPVAFRFQITEPEYHSYSRSQIATLNTNEDKKPQRGENIKYLPYAYTEQGVIGASLKDLGKKQVVSQSNYALLFH
jgi:hypothetical protein